MLNAYTGITFSFQWSLMLLLGIIQVTFFITFEIEFMCDKTFNLMKTSIDEMQTSNRRR